MNLPHQQLRGALQSIYLAAQGFKAGREEVALQLVQLEQGLTQALRNVQELKVIIGEGRADFSFFDYHFTLIGTPNKDRSATFILHWKQTHRLLPNRDPDYNAIGRYECIAGGMVEAEHVEDSLTRRVVLDIAKIIG